MQFIIVLLVPNILQKILKHGLKSVLGIEYLEIFYLGILGILVHDCLPVVKIIHDLLPGL